MIPVEEALRILRERVPTREARGHPVDEALGLRLAADVASARDLPSFPKSQMDGLAVRAADLHRAGDTVQVVATVWAGESYAGPLQPGQAVRIMTGGVIPDGCDAVVPAELVNITAGTARCHGRPHPGDHLLRQGDLVRAGDIVLPAGTRIGPVQWALLLEIGCHLVIARPRIRAAVLATGTELVDRIETADTGRTVNTNGPMLTALLQDFGCEVTSLGVSADDADLLRDKVAQGLQYDLLVTTGGVSAGERDLVPATLAAAGVHPWFHGVQMKPGKPLWFGTTDSGTVVVGLPGNPVSAFVGFQLFVRTALAALTDNDELAPRWRRAVAAQAWKGTSNRQTFWPVRRHATDWDAVEWLPWRGSSDLPTLAMATGLTRIPAGTSALAAGQAVDYMDCAPVAGMALARNGTNLPD